MLSKTNIQEAGQDPGVHQGSGTATPLPFLIGTASASMQIEGSVPPSNWSQWAARGKVADGTTPHPATDHWRRWKEDNQLMQQLGLRIARVSVEWARIEPSPGRFDEEALARYGEEFRDLRSRGISPLVTLHHFSHPLWFEQAGAFCKESNVELFLRFVAKVVDTLGQDIDDWITINEPNVYATQAYLFRESPPGKRSFGKLRSCLRNLALAHIRAYQMIHRKLDGSAYSDGSARTITVSFAHHVRVFAPRNPRNPVHRLFSCLDRWLFQDVIARACVYGEFSRALGAPSSPVSPGVYCDVMSVNYYSRSAVSGIDDGVFPDSPVTDLGWEVYPLGLRDVCRELFECFGLPVWVTENGTADNRRNAEGEALERFRCAFLLDHLEALGEVCAEGVPVQRYYHWCFVDNWEWSEGMAAEFGIVAMQPETLERVVKPSGFLLRDLIKAGEITQEISQRYREPGGYPRDIALSRPV